MSASVPPEPGSPQPTGTPSAKTLTRAPHEYKQSNVTAIVARQLDQAGVKLRPGETIEYILTDTGAHLPDDRARAWTLWEGWRGYDVNKYKAALRDAFKPFEQYARAALPLLRSELLVRCE